MSLFGELILISIGKRNAFSRMPSEDDWQAMFREAQRQSLVSVLLTGVEKAIAMGAPKPLFLMK